MPWLWPSVPVRGGARRPSDFRILDAWKLFDNLRRSLVPPALVTLLFVSWLLTPALAKWSLGLLGAVVLGPLLLRQVSSLARAATAPKPHFGALGGELSKNLLQLALGVMLLLDQALLSCDGIVRTLYRLSFSRRHMLEWTTMSQAARRHRKGA
ncbi:MAG TPA: hypothetical protein VNG33_18100 [Polyangiaceae bacterium]|nr:hypothetical protein [Polyangiaceae bacterium]